MKMSELRELTNEEIIQKMEDMKEELFNFRFQKAMNKLENHMKIRSARRDIARLNTLITEREKVSE